MRPIQLYKRDDIVVSAIGCGGVVDIIIVHATALEKTCMYLQKRPVYLYQRDLYDSTKEMI